MSFARIPSCRCVDFRGPSQQDRAVLELIILLLRAIGLACCGHEDIVLENLALRHQLRTVRSRDAAMLGLRRQLRLLAPTSIGNPRLLLHESTVDQQFESLAMVSTTCGQQIAPRCHSPEEV
jgi:hypothetical protein